MARKAIIRKVNPYELHGVRYFQLFVSYLDATDSVYELRLPHDVVYPSPQDGDTVSVEAILSIVTAVSKVEDEEG